MYCLPNLDLVSTHLIKVIDLLICATAAHANYICNHLQLSRSKLPHKKHLFPAQYLHFVIFGTIWNHAGYLELCEHVWYLLFLHLIRIYNDT